MQPGNHLILQCRSENVLSEGMVGRKSFGVVQSETQANYLIVEFRFQDLLSVADGDRELTTNEPHY